MAKSKGKNSKKKGRSNQTPKKTPAAGNQLINDPANVVDEMMKGLLIANPNLLRIEGSNTVVRRDYLDVKKTRVALISGGGSGHEPAHAGFVGQGMLTACVAGGVFASPDVASILTAIRTCTGDMGCLLIVKNYTGDRINFGLAAEQAKVEGLKVEVTIVGDDVALECKGITGRRGLAGTLFVHKVAGAAAERCATLSDVLEEAEGVAASMGTMGVALTTCTLPGQSGGDRLAHGDMEVGLGIHGEPGVLTTPLEGADAVSDRLVNAILDGFWKEQIGFEKGDQVALIINNLGGTPTLELLICLRRIKETLTERGFEVTRVFVGTLVTSLDMVGMSLTIMRLNPCRLTRIDAKTFAPAWPNQTELIGMVPHTSTIPAPLEEKEEKKEVEGLLQCDGEVVGALVAAATKALADHEAALTEMDTHVGDGDCGITHRRGAAAVRVGVRAMSQTHGWGSAASLMLTIAGAVRGSMGGTSGVMYDIIFRSAAGALATKDTTGASEAMQWVNAIDCGVKRSMFYGGAKPGYRTMLDALVPALQEAKTLLAEGQSPAQALEAATAAAVAGAEATKSMTALAGRSSYIPIEKLQAHMDPGASAVARVLEAILKTFKEMLK